MNESKNSDSNLILISAGGTGGHIFPAQALGTDLLSRGFKVAVATDKRGLKFKDMFEGMDVYKVSSGTAGRGISGKLKGAGALGLGVTEAFALLRRLKPSVVVGFGGYPSFPSVFVAQKMNIPTVIHEQNAILGKANVMLAPKAERIAVSYPEATGVQESDKINVIHTGNPVRSDIASLFNKPYVSIGSDGPVNILVLGGSLGASIFSEVVPKALSSLDESYRSRLNVVQQCREEDLEGVRKIYQGAGIEARTDTFFRNVAELFEWSHLIISRSGASTVAEVTAAGRPAIFVPYPYHADQQQKINAGYVSDNGGGWTILQDAFTPEVLASRMEIFLENPESLFHAAEQARSLGRADAARRLGNLVTALSRGW